MPHKRVRVVVEGRVQGVFFRACTKDEADMIGVNGWVRNRPDRSVETVIQGEAEKVDRMISWLRQGSPMSIVERLRVNEEEVREGESGFDIRY